MKKFIRGTLSQDQQLKLEIVKEWDDFKIRVDQIKKVNLIKNQNSNERSTGLLFQMSDKILFFSCQNSDCKPHVVNTEEFGQMQKVYLLQHSSCLFYYVTKTDSEYNLIHVKWNKERDF